MQYQEGDYVIITSLYPPVDHTAVVRPGRLGRIYSICTSPDSCTIFRVEVITQYCNYHDREEPCYLEDPDNRVWLLEREITPASEEQVVAALLGLLGTEN
jgi:hypothetical protein